MAENTPATVSPGQLATADQYNTIVSFFNNYGVASYASDPATPNEGQIWFNSTEGSFKFFAPLATFNGSITGTGNTGTLIAGTGILGTANTFSALQTFGNDISFGGATLDVASLATNDLLQYNGTDWVNVLPTALGLLAPVSNASDTELTATTATVVASFTPFAQGNFMVMVYFRVVTAATVVTIKVAYTDGTGAQTITVVNAVSEAVGSYTLTPVYVNATTATAIEVEITASVANQVYVSADIVAV